MRTHIIFDLDGTLAHTAPDLLATLNRITKPHGIKPIKLENIGQVVGHGAKAMIARAFEVNGVDLTARLHEELFSSFLTDYNENLAVETHLFEGVVAAMDVLEKDGFDFSVCTNKMIEMATPLLDQLGVSNRFKSVSGGNSFDFKKPDPRHLEETVKLAGKPLGQAIMIGDSATDINAAINAQIPSVAVTFGYSNGPVQELGASAVIDHFSKLPETIERLRSF